MIVLAKIFASYCKQKAQIFLSFLFLITGCSSPRYQSEINGYTMGTTYTIKIITDYNLDVSTLSAKVDSILNYFNSQMSTWDPESEISKFNSNQEDTTFSLSSEFYTVLLEAENISKTTNGAFDITVFDLMSLWGFGPEPKSGHPKNDEIKEVLSNTGWSKLVLKSGTIKKLNPKTKLDLNAIAKGYAVDLLHEKIYNLGYKDIFVEIGGEVKCSGKNKLQRDWVVGLENPDMAYNDIIGIIRLNNSAMATSGNYRNFIDKNGEILGHTVDPRIGKPILSDVLSSTVISSSCMKADAWATALMVMNFKEGKNKIDSNPDLEAIWILSDDRGNQHIEKTSGINFKKL